MKLAAFVLLTALALSLPASGKTVDLGPYTLSFNAPSDLFRGEYDTPMATEDETLYAYAIGNRDASRVCVIYLHDGLVPFTPEYLNNTLDFWLSVGTVRVKTWNVSTEETIAYRGEGVTTEGALQAYGYSKAFNIAEDGSGVNMFIVTKTVGLTIDEAEGIFYSMKLT